MRRMFTFLLTNVCYSLQVGPERVRTGELNMNDPPLDLFFDASESNTGTGSTDLFSDDTDERKRSGAAVEVASASRDKEAVPVVNHFHDLALWSCIFM